MRSRDPRVRQTINQIHHNLESANETAQEGLYTFSHNYVVPCFAAIGTCIYSCTAPCLPSREDQLRRRRRGRAEANFDFYDDWDNEDPNDGLLGWGTDELDRLLAGSGLARGSSEQPRRQRKMSYGARRTRRKSTAIMSDDRNDPTVIPSSSFLGFLERFPWRFGARGLKYRPSAADLQEHPVGLRRHELEDEPLIEETEESEGPATSRVNGRYRSSTQSSRDTTNSLSSRGDLIPSDEEEDAVPLDDEFALALASRRGTGLDSIDLIGDKPATDLKKEEEQAALEEESEIARRRLAAQQLASTRGLHQAKDEASQNSPSPQLHIPSLGAGHHEPADTPLDSTVEHTVPQSQDVQSQSSLNPGSPGIDSQTEPFPPFPSTPEFRDASPASHPGHFHDQSNASKLSDQEDTADAPRDDASID
ncbi:hypothetical protein CAN33_001055 [Aspergillus niger]|uniref:Uncharacterized protein n=1 Tax=Aspergillus niger TaxID=5061 RepID=A0A505I1X9_ASPNG|nr:hypothetical protein CAN33_001055 [Aspergillus niger]